MTKCNISATVDAPEGLPPIKALLTCKPATRAEFDAVVKAMGGACAFDYHAEESAHAHLDDGTTLILSAPESESRAHWERPLSESIRSLKEACKR